MANILINNETSTENRPESLSEAAVPTTDRVNLEKRNLLEHGIRLQKEKNRLESEIDLLRKELSEREKTIRGKGESIDLLEREKNFLQINIGELNEVIATLNSRMEASKADLRSRRETIEGNEAEIRSLNDRISTFQQQSDALLKQVDQCQAEIRGLHERIENGDRERNKLQSQMEKEGREKKNLLVRIESEKREKENLLARIESEKRKQENLLAQIASGKRERDGLQTRIEKGNREKENLLAQIASGKRERDGLQTRIEKGNREKDELVTENENLRSRNILQEKQLNEQRKEIEKLLRKADLLRESLSSLEMKSRTETTKTAEKIQALNEKIREMHEDRERRRVESRNQGEKIGNLQNQIQRYRDDQATQNRRLDDLKKLWLEQDAAFAELKPRLRELEGRERALKKNLGELWIRNDQAWEVAEACRLKRMGVEYPNDVADGPVTIPYCEIYLLSNCNLKCRACAVFTPYRKGVVPADKVIEWYDTWSRKIRPKRMRLIGGEPLLHPEIERILYASKQYWTHSELFLVTNGLLLEKKDDHFFKALRNTGTAVVVSNHFADQKEFDDRIALGQKILADYGITCHIKHSSQQWIRFNDEDEDGHPIPFRSNYVAAYHNCTVDCVTLHDNALYRCSRIQAIQKAREEGFLGDEWKAAMSYRPLTPESTPDEIAMHLSPGAMKECSICPVQYDFVENVQLHKIASLRQNKKNE